MTDLSKDLEICNVATDGPWTTSPWYAEHSGRPVGSNSGVIAESCSKRNAEFISHFNPEKVREMLEHIAELEAWRDSAFNIHPNIDMDIEWCNR